LSVAVFNAGSSSLKLGLYDENAAALATGSIDWEGGDSRQGRLRLQRPGAPQVTGERDLPDMAAAVTWGLEALGGAEGAALRGGITAVGQRVVHGGTKLLHSVRVDAAVTAEIHRLSELAPLHNPPALEAIRAVEAALPGVPQVAVFDTAFYATLAPAHFVFPVPYAWYEAWGVRRFGFHGISHAYCAARAAELVPGREKSALRVVTCHLGSGCSATASRGGTAVATTMGFTPLDGLMMGTRPGSLDPGILTHVMTKHGLAGDDLDDVLNHGAGLKGVSGVSSDYRLVESAAAGGHARARLALEMFGLRVQQAVGALAVTLGGVDALVFTAGVGEHAAALRAAVCTGTECLGLRLDPKKNSAGRADCDVAAADSPGRILVIHTDEELVIARQTLGLTSSSRRD
jgi:acetate kinase